MTTQPARRFIKAIAETSSRIEDAHGHIQDLEQVEIPMNFGGPTAQA